MGGNSRKSRERVARFGQGWAPMLASGPMAGTVRTARLETLDDLARGIDDLRQRLADAGRDPAAVAVQCEAGMTVAEAVADPEAFRSRLDGLAALGVTHVMLSAGRREPHEAEDTLDAFGAIAPDLRPV
jgi:alkanesulfonate monooxygenase SsuD/methylene tetrahydromethanopterin reductase-like flavin-dependent oxidoreductase (luciferase family)